MMLPLQYFQLKRSVLPNPNGSLSKMMPLSSIVTANDAVLNLNLIEQKTAGEASKRQGPYVRFTAE